MRLMRRRLLVSTVALSMTAITGIASGPVAWGQHHEGGCDGYEGDHGRGCLPAANDECEDGGSQPFDLFENLLESRGRCI